MLKWFYCFESWRGKLDINKLVNAATILNNLKTKLDDLNAAKSKTVSIDLRKWRDAVGIEVIKNTEFNALNTKADNLEKKISDANKNSDKQTDKQNSEKKIIEVSGLVATIFWIQKLVELRTKYQTKVV